MRKLILRREVQAPPIAHRIVAFGDCHLEAGIELTPAYRVAKKFCHDLHPDIGINLGDWLDLNYMSKFTKDAPLLVEGRRYQKDCDLSKRELESWRACFQTFEFIPGNHDDRIARYVERFPILQDRLDARGDYGISALGIGWTEFNEVLSIGKLNFTHGWYWNQYHAAKHLRDMGDHLFYGHVHDHQVACKPVRAKRLPFIAMSLGCLGNLNPIWKRNKPNEWLNGLGVFEVAASGNFSPFFVPIIDGELTYGGYTWKA